MSYHSLSSAVGLLLLGGLVITTASYLLEAVREHRRRGR